MAKFLLRLAGLATMLMVLGLGVAFAQVTNTYNGILTVIWGDPKPGVAGGGIYFELTESNGATHPLQIAPEQRNTAIQFFGKHVTVQGHASAERAAASPSTIVVDDITLAEPKNAVPQQVRAKIVKRVLFVLLQFKGDTQITHPVSFYDRELTNPKKPPAGSQNPATINGFFNKTSWGALQWKADVAGKEGLNPTHWLKLSKTRDQYGLNCGPQGSCASPLLTSLATEAMNLVVGAGVDVSVYDNVNLVFNSDLDCCAWGGSFTFNGKFYGATWEPPWGQETSVYVHEMGHSLGLPHSGWRYYAYDSHHDEMSRGNPAAAVQCGMYNSPNFGGPNTPISCTKPGAGYIGAHKDFLNWVPAANKAVMSTKGSKTFVIEAQGRPLGSRLKLVVICIGTDPCSGGEGTNAHFLTVEVKKNGVDFEDGLPSEGVVIHEVLMNRRNTISGPCFFNNQNGWAIPYDATPNDFDSSSCSPQDVAGHGLMNMPYVVGKKFTSNPFHAKVEVLSETSTTMTVRVTKTK